MCYKPIPRMIGEINEHLRGSGNHFGQGYPRKAFREINHCVRDRLSCHLSRRGQRPWQPPKGTTRHEQFKKMGNPLAMSGKAPDIYALSHPERQLDAKGPRRGH